MSTARPHISGHPRRSSLQRSARMWHMFSYNRTFVANINSPVYTWSRSGGKTFNSQYSLPTAVHRRLVQCTLRVWCYNRPSIVAAFVALTTMCLLAICCFLFVVCCLFVFCPLSISLTSCTFSKRFRLLLVCDHNSLFAVATCSILCIYFTATILLCNRIVK